MCKILALKPYKHANDNRTPNLSTSTNPAAPLVLRKELLSKMLALKPSKNALRGIKKYKSLWAMHRQVVFRASAWLDVPLHSCLLELVVDVGVPYFSHPGPKRYFEVG